MGQALWKTDWRSTNLSILLLYDPAVALFGIYLQGLKTYVHTKACMHIEF